MRRLLSLSLAALLCSCAAGGDAPLGSGGNGGETSTITTTSRTTTTSASGTSTTTSSTTTASNSGAGGSGGGASTGGAGGMGGSGTSSSSTSASSSGVVGPAPIGLYSYTAVPPSGLLNPPSAAWHPSGAYALIPSANDKLFRYDPVTHSVAQVAQVGTSVVWRAIGFTPDGSKAVLLGNVNSPLEGRIYLWDHATSQLSQMTSETFAGGTYESIAWSPDGASARLLASKKNAGAYIAYLWLFDPNTGRSDVKAQATSAGCQDLAFATDGFDMPAVPVTCGVNGVSLFYLDTLGAFVSYSGNAGNTSTISARPQGDYALAIGWSGQRVYRFQQGNWSTAFGNPTFPGIYQVQFSTDGRRALILGGYGGNPAVGQAYEFRNDVFTQSGIVEVSIPNFALPPYNASSQARLNDVAWRPGCEGGLVVGGANTVTSQQAFVIRFSVDNGVPCPN